MGKKNRFRKIQIVTLFCLIFSLLSSGRALAFVDLPMEMVLERDSLPLTTERVISINPNSTNPHRQRWAVGRQVDLVNLSATESKDERFGVRAQGLRIVLKTHLRADGPWFRKLEEFPCHKQFDDRFATQEGAEYSLTYAANRWFEIAKSRKQRLIMMLDAISASTQQIAVIIAGDILQQWQREVDYLWTIDLADQGEKREWDLYISLTKEICKQPRARVLPSWSLMMEPPQAMAPPPKMLGRSPARRWDGMFSVRLNLAAGKHTVSGKFLIDSGAPVSLVSPSWLRAQGIIPETIEVPLSPLEKVTWLNEGHSGWGKRVRFDGGDVGGAELPIREFLAYDTTFFEGPDFVTTCCDGVLGNDFLSRSVVEIVSQDAAEMKFWESRLFVPTKSSQLTWVEAAVGRHGLLESADCYAKVGERMLSPLSWDTGNDEFVSFSKMPKDRSFVSEGLDLYCSKTKLNSSPISQKDISERDDVDGAVVAAGMNLLEQGRFILDLPHGRLWLSNEIGKKQRIQNKTGINLVFKLVDGERVLTVKKLGSSQILDDLRKQGLKEGVQVLSVDGRPAEEMDLWNIERRLAGDSKKDVQLKIKLKAEEKTIVVPVI